VPLVELCYLGGRKDPQTILRYSKRPFGTCEVAFAISLSFARQSR